MYNIASSLKHQAFFVLPEGHKPRPWLISDIIKRLEKLAFKPHEGLIHLLLLNPSFKKKRIERLEAICCVAQVLVYYTNFRTMLVEIPQKERAAIGITLKTIAQKTGLNLRRVKRAVGDLIKAGYLESTQQVKRFSEGVFKGLASIKKLARKFFYHLGIKEKQLRKLQAFKEKQHQESLPQVAPAVMLEAELIRSKVVKTFTAAKKATEKIPQSIAALLAKKFTFTR